MFKYTRIILLFCFISFLSCENTITSSVHTIKANHIILIAEDGAEYSLKVRKNSDGNPELYIIPAP